jgi:hypothetical protein
MVMFSGLTTAPSYSIHAFINGVGSQLAWPATAVDI